MKILFGGVITILIREEDFTEINVDQDMISYIRPNGTQALIKFKDKIPGFDLDHQDKVCSTPKWQDKAPAAERRFQSPMVYAGNNQTQKLSKSNKPQNILEKKFIELDSNLNHLSQSLASQFSEVNMVLDKKLTELQQIHEIDSNQNSKVHESSSPCNMNELHERGMIINDVNQERYDTQDDLIKNLSAEGLKIIKAMDDQIEARMFYEKENKSWRQMGFTEREKKALETT